MKCVKCGCIINPDDKYYEIDVYRFNFGSNINYLEEVILCKKCFDGIEWLKKNDTRGN